MAWSPEGGARVVTGTLGGGSEEEGLEVEQLGGEHLEGLAEDFAQLRVGCGGAECCTHHTPLGILAWCHPQTWQLVARFTILLHGLWALFT